MLLMKIPMMILKEQTLPLDEWSDLCPDRSALTCLLESDSWDKTAGPGSAAAKLCFCSTASNRSSLTAFGLWLSKAVSASL